MGPKAMGGTSKMGRSFLLLALELLLWAWLFSSPAAGLDAALGLLLVVAGDHND